MTLSSAVGRTLQSPCRTLCPLSCRVREGQEWECSHPRGPSELGRRLACAVFLGPFLPLWFPALQWGTRALRETLRAPRDTPGFREAQRSRQVSDVDSWLQVAPRCKIRALRSLPGCRVSEELGFRGCREKQQALSYRHGAGGSGASSVAPAGEPCGCGQLSHPTGD